MRKEHEYKSDEARQREQAHWFGREGGNVPCKISEARNQRTFYRWCECDATEEQLKDYVLNKENPLARRKFVAALLKCIKVQDFFELTNQTSGMPKQSVSFDAPEQIKINFE